MVRAAVLGGVAALGIPLALKDLEGPLGDFISRSSEHARIGEIWIRWNWGIFAVVTALAFILLQVTRNR